MKRVCLTALSLLLALVLLCACGGAEESSHPPASDAGTPPPSQGKPSGDTGSSGGGTANDDALALGDSFLMGTYEQDGNTENGKEPIAWTVLAMEEGRMLLLSEHVLDAMPYHTTAGDVTWETSSLRAHLGSAFLSAAFSAEDAAKILTVTLQNPDNGKQGTEGGRDTADKVFLLSAAEADTYLTAEALRRAKPTAAAIRKGVWVQETGYAPSWLRSPGGTADRAMILHEGGAASFGEFADSITVGVRPAMWVSYTK